MKCVIFINSLLGLMTAIQIRETMYRNCKFDIIMSDMVPELKAIYENNVLNEKFSNVKFIEYRKIKKNEKLLFFISPDLYMRKMLGGDFEDYTDIFFWNPTLLLHSCLIYLDANKRSYALHVYGDALGSYVTDCPSDHEHFRNEKLNMLVAHVKGFRFVEDMDYDYYVFSQKFISFDTKRTIVEIPKIKDELICYYNRLFLYNNRNAHIENRIIFMDKQHDDQFANTDFGLEVIKEIIAVVGSHELIVKPHPRQNLEIYADYINILQNVIPWELYCLNNNISDKVIISYGSTALYMPYIFDDRQKYTMINFKIGSSFETIFEKEYEEFVEKMKVANPNFYEVENISQFKEILENIICLRDK